ncbi:phosphatidate cytidylyltransferase [Allonocardiopsis opalescens]|uniref:Phosphatidate cytidylyltransferase n=1 Tax=Allonocardiopsis opalescens TaxID=1144618 RepID=A0A2T0PVH4_9ACTN|nr:phosphatidate cytidylyltransferase [Allonocardiopsis opalescens]PRX95534.1 phosphatidate cytidylyltransferase [Allonocardiopsis opalescens]
MAEIPPEAGDGASGKTSAPRIRTGRNLPVAVATSLALGALILIPVLFAPAALVAVVGIGQVLALWELKRAFGARGIHLAVVPVAAGGAAMAVTAYVSGTTGLTAALVVTVVVVMIWRLPGPANGYVRDVTAGVFAAVYVPFLVGFWMLLLAAPADGPVRFLTFVIVTICSDIGGYFAGILFGRNRLAPTISPKKTWEGFAGSALSCAVAGALCVALMLGGPPWLGVLLGLAVAVIATLGDLVESSIKRDLGIKDMGSFLPEHGGLLDRVDALLITAPMAWLFLALTLPPG